MRTFGTLGAAAKRIQLTTPLPDDQVVKVISRLSPLAQPLRRLPSPPAIRFALIRRVTPSLMVVKVIKTVSEGEYPVGKQIEGLTLGIVVETSAESVSAIITTFVSGSA